MRRSEPRERSIVELSSLIAAGDLTPTQLVESCLEGIEQLNPVVGAVKSVNRHSAMDLANAASEDWASGRSRGPLHGIPFIVKDQFDLDGDPSPFWGERRQQPDIVSAEAVGRLRMAGAIPIGRAVMTGQADPSPRNPWSLDRGTGGSSSGSAAAVAAGMCPLALGVDSAGSVRNPAALCGVVGSLPTQGAGSNSGLAPMSWTLDRIGPITRCVQDAALVTSALSRQSKVSDGIGSEGQSGRLDGLVIGVPPEAWGSDRGPVAADVAEQFRGAVGVLKSLGAQVVAINVPGFSDANDIAFVIYSAEYHAAYRGLIEDFSRTARSTRYVRLAYGALTPAADYVHARRLRSQHRRDVANVHTSVDLIATPTTPTVAPVHTIDVATPAVPWWEAPSLTASVNLTGFPALTVPCGLDSDGLPVGLHLSARPREEALLFRVAALYEELGEWHGRTPSLS